MTDSDSRSTPGDLPHESHNARRFVIANGVQNLGDQLVAAKTVLPWLFQAAGVPAALTALLVPTRESGSMLPRAALPPGVLNSPSRKKLWIIGGIVQALAALGIAVAAVVLESLALGLVVLVLLGMLSIGRALCSITGKDVQGQTISISPPSSSYYPSAQHRGLWRPWSLPASSSQVSVSKLSTSRAKSTPQSLIRVSTCGGGAIPGRYFSTTPNSVTSSSCAR